MARITVEDCIDKFPSRFELVLVASQRARKLHSGDEPTVEKDNDKNTVIALREIADTSFTVEEMKENLIQEYQTVTISDEENENQEIESLELELTKSEITEEKQSLSDNKDNANTEGSLSDNRETDEEIHTLNHKQEIEEEIEEEIEIEIEKNDLYFFSTDPRSKKLR